MHVREPWLVQQVFESDSYVIHKTNIDTARSLFYQMKEDLSLRIAGLDLRSTLNLLIQYLFCEKKILPVNNDRCLAGDFDLRLVTNLILKQSGFCVELSLLFLMLARSLSVTCYGIVLPMHHMLIGFGDSNNPKYIELSQLGKFEDVSYVEKLSRSYSRLSKIEPVVCDSDEKVVAVYWNLIGHVLYRKGQLEKAKTCFEKAIQFDHNFPRLHYSFGYVLYSLGQKDLAIQQMKEELRIDPDFIHAQLHLAYFLLDHNGDCNGAREILKIVLSKIA